MQHFSVFSLLLTTSLLAGKFTPVCRHWFTPVICLFLLFNCRFVWWL